MYRKNVAGQFIYFCMVTVAGVADTGATVTCKRCIDGGAQATAGGTTTHRGGGQYEFALTQADTNGNNISYLFTATGDLPVEKTIVTTAADPTDSVRFGLTALPNAAAEAAGGLYTRGSGAGQINQPANGLVDVNTLRWNGTAVSAPATAGIPDVNVKNINNVSAAAVTTVKAVQGLTTADTIATYTGNTPQTGDAFARLGAAGAGLTALGDTRIANLDATVSSRMATYTQPTGFLAATFPASVASPTNITAGVITTVTNLTNAPTAGDFTATMKASIGTAVAASAVASVTAAVGITSSVKKNQALTKFQFLMTDSATNAPKTGLTVSVTRSIDGGVYAAGTLANVTEISSGMYTVDFGAGDLNGTVVVLQATAVGANSTFERVITQP